MPRARLFDYDEAIRLKDTGLSYVEIGKRLGVSRSAIYWACNPKRREEAFARKAIWQRQGVCVDCGEPCTRTGGRHGQRCRSCAVTLRATSVRDTELRCGSCGEWKPDRAFPSNRHRGSDVRRGRHRECRACGTASKRAYRERTRVPCAGGCGRLVNTTDRPDKRKPPVCFYCAMARNRLAA